jgi:hypothetical protein
MASNCAVGICRRSNTQFSDETPSGSLSFVRHVSTTSVHGRFCCRSRLKASANNDSLTLTRSAAGAGHDGSVGAGSPSHTEAVCDQFRIPAVDGTAIALGQLELIGRVIGIQMPALGAERTGTARQLLWESGLVDDHWRRMSIAERDRSSRQISPLAHSKQFTHWEPK